MPQTRTFMVWDVLAIAILQASVIICGLLMAQSTDNRAGFLGPLPWSGGILADFGWVALVIPLSWLWWILHVRRNRNAPPKSDTPAFLFGLAILMILFSFVAYAVVRPFLGREFPGSDVLY